jgi:phage terminase small subunit
LSDLTPKQQRFVAEYLIDSNATQAAIRAGYSAASAKVTASRLLTKANIRAAVDAKQTKIVNKLEITAESLIRDVRDIGDEARMAESYAAAIKSRELLGRSLKEANPFAETFNVNAKVEDVTERNPLEIARRMGFLLSAGVQRPDEPDPLH